VAAVSPRYKGREYSRFAVRPYPSQWVRHLVLADNWKILVRPIRPEDENLVRAFFAKVSQEDLRLRFFAPVKELNHTFIARLTQLDYARAIAFIAIDEATGEMIGGIRLHADANYETAEYAVLLRSDLKGRGLGWKLMELIIEYAQSEGLKRIEGQILQDNSAMIRMCREFGFRIEKDPRDPDVYLASLSLSGSNVPA
jgi:acetyltransferase